MFHRLAVRRSRAAREAADADACAYGALLLAEAREEITRSDAKAQVLLGVVGIGLSAVAGGLLAGNWSPTEISPAVQWLWWFGLGAELGAVTVLSAAVYPRTKRRSGLRAGTLMYFADVSPKASAAEVTAALRLSATLDLSRVADQIQRISQILDRKHRLIRAGFWLIFSGIVAAVSALLIDLAV